jgi:hypothetical protein
VLSGKYGLTREAAIAVPVEAKVTMRAIANCVSTVCCALTQVSVPGM